MITITNVSKTYQSKNGQINALKGVDLKVDKGQIFGIIGQSGAGKSTLIRCINMLEVPTKGNIIVDNQDMTTLKAKDLRRARQKIGMIFQHFNLLTSRTIFDNIAYPLEIQGVDTQTIKQKVLPLLELVGLSDRANYYPSQLSGGQKQRVGIARALASDPKVLLCDEATSALDPQTTASILQLLKDINQKFGLTIVLITHEMNVIKQICDKVAVIEDGLIVEQGDVLEIFTNPKTKTAHEFISTITNHDLPANLSSKLLPYDKNSLADNLIVRLSFIGDSATQPVISSAIKLFNVDVSIIYGNIDTIKNTPYGTLIAEITGDAGKIQEAIAHLIEQQLQVEVLGYVRADN